VDVKSIENLVFLWGNFEFWVLNFELRWCSLTLTF
jgi:hypothetical protein